MPLPKPLLKLTYPLPVYNFRAEVGSASMSFSEVSGVAVQHEQVTYRHGLSFLEGETIVTANVEKFAPITLRRGTVRGVTELWDWLHSRELRPLRISLCDERGAPAVTWHVGKAVPVKLAAPSFEAGSNEVAIESLEVMGARVTLEHHPLVGLP